MHPNRMNNGMGRGSLNSGSSNSGEWGRDIHGFGNREAHCFEQGFGDNASMHARFGGSNFNNGRPMQNVFPRQQLNQPMMRSDERSFQYQPYNFPGGEHTREMESQRPRQFQDHFQHRGGGDRQINCDRQFERDQRLHQTAFQRQSENADYPFQHQDVQRHADRPFLHSDFQRQFQHTGPFHQPDFQFKPDRQDFHEQNRQNFHEQDRQNFREQNQQNFRERNQQNVREQNRQDFCEQNRQDFCEQNRQDFCEQNRQDFCEQNRQDFHGQLGQQRMNRSQLDKLKPDLMKLLDIFYSKDNQGNKKHPGRNCPPNYNEYQFQPRRNFHSSDFSKTKQSQPDQSGKKKSPVTSEQSTNQGSSLGKTDLYSKSSTVVSGRDSNNATKTEAASSPKTSTESGKISTESGKTFTNSGKTSIESGKTSTESGKTSTESGKTSTESGKTSIESGKTSTESGKTSIESGKTSTESGKTSTESRKPSTESGKTSTESAKTSTESGTSSSDHNESVQHTGTKEEENATSSMTTVDAVVEIENKIKNTDTGNQVRDEIHAAVLDTKSSDQEDEKQHSQEDMMLTSEVHQKDESEQHPQEMQEDLSRREEKDIRLCGSETLGPDYQVAVELVGEKLEEIELDDAETGTFLESEGTTKNPSDTSPAKSPGMKDRKNFFSQDRLGKSNDPSRPSEPGKAWSSSDYFTGSAVDQPNISQQTSDESATDQSSTMVQSKTTVDGTQSEQSYRDKNEQLSSDKMNESNSEISGSRISVIGENRTKMTMQDRDGNNGDRMRIPRKDRYSRSENLVTAGNYRDTRMGSPGNYRERGERTGTPGKYWYGGGERVGTPGNYRERDEPRIGSPGNYKERDERIGIPGKDWYGGVDRMGSSGNRERDETRIGSPGNYRERQERTGTPGKDWYGGGERMERSGNRERGQMIEMSGKEGHSGDERLGNSGEDGYSRGERFGTPTNEERDERRMTPRNSRERDERRMTPGSSRERDERRMTPGNSRERDEWRMPPGNSRERDERRMTPGNSRERDEGRMPPGNSRERDERRSTPGNSQERDERRMTPGNSQERDERRMTPGNSQERDERRMTPGNSRERDERRMTPGNSRERDERRMTPGNSRERDERRMTPGNSRERDERRMTPGNSGERDERTGAPGRDAYREKESTKECDRHRNPVVGERSERFEYDRQERMDYSPSVSDRDRYHHRLDERRSFSSPSRFPNERHNDSDWDNSPRNRQDRSDYYSQGRFYDRRQDSHSPRNPREDSGRRWESGTKMDSRGQNAMDRSGNSRQHIAQSDRSNRPPRTRSIGQAMEMDVQRSSYRDSNNSNSYSSAGKPGPKEHETKSANELGQLFNDRRTAQTMDISCVEQKMDESNKSDTEKCVGDICSNKVDQRLDEKIGTNQTVVESGAGTTEEEKAGKTCKLDSDKNIKVENQSLEGSRKTHLEMDVTSQRQNTNEKIDEMVIRSTEQKNESCSLTTDESKDRLADQNVDQTCSTDPTSKDSHEDQRSKNDIPPCDDATLETKNSHQMDVDNQDENASDQSISIPKDQVSKPSHLPDSGESMERKEKVSTQQDSCHNSSHIQNKSQSSSTEVTKSQIKTAVVLLGKITSSQIAESKAETSCTAEIGKLSKDLVGPNHGTSDHTHTSQKHSSGRPPVERSRIGFETDSLSLDSQGSSSLMESPKHAKQTYSSSQEKMKDRSKDKDTDDRSDRKRKSSGGSSSSHSSDRNRGASHVGRKDKNELNSGGHSHRHRHRSKEDNSGSRHGHRSKEDNSGSRHRHRSKEDNSGSRHRHWSKEDNSGSRHTSKGDNSSRTSSQRESDSSRQTSKDMRRSGQSGVHRGEDRRGRYGRSAQESKDSENTAGTCSDLDIDEDDSDDELEAPFFLTALNEASSRPIPSTPTKGLHGNSDSPAPSSPPITLDPMPSHSSGFSLDALLAEAIDKTSEERQCEDMHAELEAGLKKGGFVKDTLEDTEDPHMGELLPEHKLELKKFEVYETQMREHHPGELTFLSQRYQCLFNPEITVQACGFVPGATYIDKHLNTVQPGDYMTLLTSDILMMCFDAVSCQDAVLRWLLFIMSVHPSHLVMNGCYKTIQEHLYTSQNFTCKHTWSPAVTDIISILCNYGADPKTLLPESLGYNAELVRKSVFQQQNFNLQPVVGKYNRENFRLVLSILAMALQIRPQYTCSELTQMVVMLAKVALDKSLNNNMLTHEFNVVIASLLELYTDTDWPTQVVSLCWQLSSLTEHHHNRVYLAQLLPPTNRGNLLQRRVSYLLVHQLFLPKQKLSDDVILNFQLSQVQTVLPQLQGLAQDDVYLLASAVSLLDLCVGNGIIKSAEKDDLEQLTDQMKKLTGEVRDSVQMLDMTRVKDMMIRITSKWTLVLLSIGSKQKTLFGCSGSLLKPVAEVKIETVDASQSDHASETEEEEEEEGGGEVFVSSEEEVKQPGKTVTEVKKEKSDEIGNESTAEEKMEVDDDLPEL